MLSYWAVFNGLIIVGMAFAAITGIRMGNKELVEKIYDGKLHLPNVKDVNENLSDSEEEYVTERINVIITEKLHYIIGFAMSAIGTWGSVWFDADMPMQNCQKKLELLISIIMWWVVARILKYIFLKFKIWSIKKDIKSGKISMFKSGDIVLKSTNIDK